MDTTKRPTSVLAVEADIRHRAAHVIHAEPDSVYFQQGGPYPLLFGMATALLADANTEIARLEKLVAAMREELDHA